MATQYSSEASAVAITLRLVRGYDRLLLSRRERRPEGRYYGL